jgi:exopolysaccharide biosynthesis protein
VVTERNGSYVIPVTVLFHDNDGEAITRLRYRLLPDIDGMVDVSEPNPTRESALVTIVIPASALYGETNTALTTGGSDRASDGHGAAANDGRDRPREAGRKKARSLQLSIVDGRGAESLPTTSTVTLN